MELEYGLQLYSIADFTEYDMEYALPFLAEYGYKSVEFAGYFGHSAEQINDMLSKNGLKVIGSHIGLDILTEEKINATLDFEEAIGNKNIVFPCIDLDNAEKIKNVVPQIIRVQKETDRRGMKLHYHTHDWDFLPNDDGIIPAKALEQETGVLFEIDTFWAFFAGLDPVAEMRRLRNVGRCELVHIKDGKPNRDPAVIGEGFAPIIDIVEEADKLGLYKIVESEGYIPDGLTDVRHCLKYLKKIASGEITK